MKKLLLGVVVGCGLTCGLGVAPAMADEGGFEYSANVAMVSKYMWRGWNLNDDWSAQGGFDVGFSGFYAGVWGGTDANLGTEYDLYIGYNGELHEYFSYDVGFIQYRYPTKGLEVDEWHVTLDFSIFSATMHKGENGYQYLEFNTGVEFDDHWSLEAHYGFEDNDETDWHDYQLKLNYRINDNYGLFVAVAEKERNDSNYWFGITGNF